MYPGGVIYINGFDSVLVLPHFSKSTIYSDTLELMYYHELVISCNQLSHYFYQKYFSVRIKINGIAVERQLVDKFHCTSKQS